MSPIELTSRSPVIIPALINVYMSAIDGSPMLRVCVFRIGLISYWPSRPEGFSQFPQQLYSPVHIVSIPTKKDLHQVLCIKCYGDGFSRCPSKRLRRSITRFRIPAHSHNTILAQVKLQFTPDFHPQGLQSHLSCPLMHLMPFRDRRTLKNSNNEFLERYHPISCSSNNVPSLSLFLRMMATG